MTIVVRDLVADFLLLTPAPPGERPARWRRYADRHADVFEAYFRDLGRLEPGHLDEPLARLFADPHALHRRARTVRALSPEAMATAARLLGRDPAGIDAQIIVLVGLFRANGWVAPLAGRDELFVAVESFPDSESYGRLLLVHEAAHVVHLRSGDAATWPEHGVAAALLREGLSTYVSTVVVGADDDAGCLWFGPGHGEWLAECRRRRAEIVGRLLEDLDATDLDTFAAYFLMRDSERRGDLPRRVGYFAGLEAVRQLARRTAPGEIAGWGHDRARAELRLALRALLTRV